MITTYHNFANHKPHFFKQTRPQLWKNLHFCYKMLQSIEAWSYSHALLCWWIFSPLPLNYLGKINKNILILKFRAVIDQNCISWICPSDYQPFEFYAPKILIITILEFCPSNFQTFEFSRRKCPKLHFLIFFVSFSSHLNFRAKNGQNCIS